MQPGHFPWPAAGRRGQAGGQRLSVCASSPPTATSRGTFAWAARRQFFEDKAISDAMRISGIVPAAARSGGGRLAAKCDRGLGLQCLPAYRRPWPKRAYARMKAAATERVLTYHELGNDGRLGNQLWEIASTLGLAEYFRAEVSLNANWGSVQRVLRAGRVLRSTAGPRGVGTSVPPAAKPERVDAGLVELVGDRTPDPRVFPAPSGVPAAASPALYGLFRGARVAGGRQFHALAAATTSDKRGTTCWSAAATTARRWRDFQE